MSFGEVGSKVTARHLAHDAYLYVRQSTLRQVVENCESTQRQYALRQRAVALGWPLERVVVIDQDQGQSGASAVDRAGFQRLVAEVGLGRAGLVMGLEVSRLARNSTDWHRLLEICALTETLILDEDGIYDPTQVNDRLLLGLKGTMSEAELHVLRARLRGGIQNKARRGDLWLPLPAGLVYDAAERVVLDPDAQVQATVHRLFDTYRRTGSAMATVKAFRREEIPFPSRVRSGPKRGECVWFPLSHWRVLQVLHNPRYAGAFAFGRSRCRRVVDGHGRREKLPIEQWHTLIRDAHPAYISWQEFEVNQRSLVQHAQARGKDRRHSPPREGPALLQGLALCARCGERMIVRYHARRQRLVPDYCCQRGAVDRGVPLCQQIPGGSIDAAIGDLLVESVTPLALDVALAVQEEIQARLHEADRLREQQVVRARYEAELAEQRYRLVDPRNRLVADALEADWNLKLRSLTQAQEVCERGRQADRQSLDAGRRAQVLALANDFPRLWRDPQTPDRERKRMARLLLEDVTLIKEGQITAKVRFKGGATTVLTLPIPPTGWLARKTPPEVVAEIDGLLDHHIEAEIVRILNQRGVVSGMKEPFSPGIVDKIRRKYHLKSRYDRLRAKGLLTKEELGARLGVHEGSVRKWRRAGFLRAHTYSDRDDYLYEIPAHPPRPYQRHKACVQPPSPKPVTRAPRGAV